jgi:threonine/homoserine/homoserine lactone efflux protein
VFSAEYLVTSLVVVLIPGTGVLYTVSTGIARGWRASIAAATGCTFGIVPHLLAAALGLSAVMQLGAEVFTAVKLVGSAYLLYLAWQMWKSTGALDLERELAESGALRVAFKGVALNVLNPKLTAFFFAFIPQFVNAGSTSWTLQLVELSAVFMLMTFAVFCIYGAIASAGRSAIRNTPKAMAWMQRSFAVVFAGPAVELALSDR